MQTINTFSKGMNTDTDLSIIGKDQYLYAENFRLFTESVNTTGSLENVTGNTFLSSLQDYIDGFYICGYCTIRDELYLFITTNTSSTPSGGNSKIVKVIFNSAGTDTSSISFIYDDAMSSDGSRLNFSTANRIKAVGRYESDTIKKVYWVDGYNNIRFANVANDLTFYPVNRFEIIPNFNLSTPSFESFTTGTLTSSKVQYAYQMYNLNGGETVFSPASSLISISETSGQTGSNKTFKGSDKDINTGKGVRLSIQAPSGFNRIRVVSIKYNEYNGIPTINIIADQNISTNPDLTYFIDSGNNYLGSYTYEEFAVIGNNIFVASEIETKNDYLFAANISQTDWDVDFDARAYRFGPNGGTIITSIDGVSDEITFNINDLTTGTVTIPVTHDCYNKYNNHIPSYEGVNYNEGFKYQGDATTIGGQGLNVKYSFTGSVFNNPFQEVCIDSSGNTDIYDNNTDYSNVITETQYVGYQRDEVYRFGIVFFNNKGQASTVKWIGDIRIPNLIDNPYLAYSNGSGGIFTQPQGIVFEIDATSVVAQGAKYYRIVRCERKTDDRSILAEGLVGTINVTTLGSPAVNYYSRSANGAAYRRTVDSYTGGNINTDNTILEFSSPEVNFNKNIEYRSGDIIEAIGYMGTVATTQVSLTSGPTNRCGVIRKYKTVVPLTLTDRTYKNVTYSKICQFFNELVPIGTEWLNTYNKYYEDIQTTNKFFNEVRAYTIGTYENSPGPGGTTMIARIDSSFPSSANINSRPLLCYYKRPINDSQYGGASYQARLNNYYIACGPLEVVHIYAPDSEVTTVYGGDSYTGMFDYLRKVTMQNSYGNTTAYQEINYFPVESSINLRFRGEVAYSKLSGSNDTKLLLNEYAGTYTAQWSGALQSIKLNQVYDLYQYNSVYSQQNNSVKYFPKSDTVTSNYHNYDTRVLASDKKINGELSDSWTKFRLDNFIDVDSTYGEITTLKTYKNNLYFWQPEAYGVLSVNTRSLISDNNTSQLVLGTGGILDRYDYISNVTGCSYRFSVVAGINGLYWIDLKNKGVYRYNGQEEPISKIKGFNSLIKDMSSVTLPDSISCYDSKNNDILMTIYHNGGLKVLSYNEVLDSVNGVYTFIPLQFIETNNTNYISSGTSASGYRTYIHNIGNKGEFYGYSNPSKISLVVNDNYQETKTFDMLEYHSTSNIGGTNYLSDTFSSIRVYNDYQNSDYQTLTLNSNIIRKERGFKIAIPRNIVSNSSDIFNPINLDATRVFKERMRDKYIVVDLIYTNQTTRDFNVPYIITDYRVSKR